MDEFKAILQLGNGRTFWLIVALAAAKIARDFFVGAVQWYWKRQERLEKAADHQPEIVQALEKVNITLDKVVDRMERHEEREERVFSAILQRLDDKPKSNENESLRILRSNGDVL